MHFIPRSFFIACLTLTLTLSCSTENIPLSEKQVVDIVWLALEPNTSSHDKTAWEIVTVQEVTGQEIQDVFDDANTYCGFGPKPTNNVQISLNNSYWYIQMRPRSATPQPIPTELYSPTAPPIIPEPFIYEVHFLVDARTEQIVARNFYCIIY
jgi:hypothetical protein